MQRNKTAAFFLFLTKTPHSIPASEQSLFSQAGGFSQDVRSNAYLVFHRVPPESGTAAFPHRAAGPPDTAYRRLFPAALRERCADCAARDHTDASSSADHSRS